MTLLYAALRLPGRLFAVGWTLLWQRLCTHPGWSNPDLIGGFGSAIACRRCLCCGRWEAERLGRPAR